MSISDDESRMTPDGSTARPGPEHTPELPYVADPEEAAFQRRWGPWRPWSPEQVALMLVGLDRPWCVAGGWALDAFAAENLDGLACVADASGEAKRAARLFGAGRTLHDAVGYRHTPAERALREPCISH